jgi:plasmid stabilization system protein ParE
LEEIHGQIAKDSPLNADGMVTRILDAMEPLKMFPSRMVVIEQKAGLREPVRSVPVKPYIIYFRLVEQKKLVEIVHIRHGARRRPKRF